MNGPRMETKGELGLARRSRLAAGRGEMREQALEMLREAIYMMAGRAAMRASRKFETFARFTEAKAAQW